MAHFDLGMICALLRVLFYELWNMCAVLSQKGVSYFIKHFVCVIYLTYRNRATPLRFPEPSKTHYNPESMGLLYSDREWQQERPKSGQHLKHKEDFHIFQGTHIESNSTLIFRLSRLQEGLCQAFVALRVNGGQVLVLQNEIRRDLSDHLAYQGGGLQLESLAPMRRWRVSYNGLMKNENDEDVHARFSGVWIAESHTTEYPQQISISSMADSLSNLHPFAMASQIKSIYKDEFFYSQMGRFDLEISIDASEPEEVHLRGNRLHFSGTLEPRTESHKFAHFRNGHRVHLISREVEGQTLYFGSAYEPNWRTAIIKSGETTPRTLIARTEQHELLMSVNEVTIEPRRISTGHPKVNDTFGISQQAASLQGEIGVILTLDVKRFYRPLLAQPEEYKHHLLSRCITTESLALSIEDEKCKHPNIAGRKGASLALLSSISKQFETFAVPRAIVLTTSSYDLFSHLPAVKSAIEELSRLSLKLRDQEQLKEACERCMDVLEKTPPPPRVIEELKRKMALFGSLYHVRLAVRSSAVHEDYESASAAGRMRTFLGVKAYDLDQIAIRVAECWASQYSVAAVNFKRQLGRPIAARMAVVIQEMVPSEVSGVMFTCERRTASPRTVTIIAKYGLGESDESALADADTFSVSRSPSGQTRLKSTRIGKKQTLIAQREEEGTVEREVDAGVAEKPCLAKSLVEKLARVGHQVEVCHTTPRDIAWALVGNLIYLLQDRGIPLVVSETDFELINDMNGSVKSEGALLSKGTVAEIFPGALSPLGISTLTTAFDILCREVALRWRGAADASIYAPLTMNTFRKQVFLDVSDTEAGDKAQKSKPFAVFGRDISGEEALLKRPKRVELPLTAITKLKKLLYTSMMFFSNRNLAEVVEKSKSFNVAQNRYSSLEQLRAIVSSFSKIKPAALTYCHVLLETEFFDGIVISLLAGSNQGGITPEILNAAAQLLRIGGSEESLESVDVASSLEKLRVLLAARHDREKFLRMTPEEAFDSLSTAKCNLGFMFREFLWKHGHRCVNEFDVRSETWDMKPTYIVRILQIYLKNGLGTSSTRSVDSALSKITVPKSWARRLLLRLFVPQARRGIARRELAKSAFIRTLHAFRLAFHNLADLMVAEGRLPRGELLFFLSVDEIYRLITEGQFKLVERASRRQRLHSKLSQERYPSLSYGFPKRVEARTLSSNHNSFTGAVGSPICSGTVDGEARVVKDFEKEAQLMRNGEILITTAIDSGWTPYFPLLAGIVTEIGGLASHGAIAARESGIPCIVGIDNVTDMFATGDFVRLDGTSGWIKKLPTLQR